MHVRRHMHAHMPARACAYSDWDDDGSQCKAEARQQHLGVALRAIMLCADTCTDTCADTCTDTCADM